MREQKEYKGVRYLDYIPNNWDGKHSLLFYHGYGERGSDISKIETVVIPQQLKNGFNPRCRVISPQLTDNYTGWIERYLKAMAEVMLATESKYQHVTGLSMGGIGALAQLKLCPGLFESAGIVCGKTNSDNLEALIYTKIKAWHGVNDKKVGISQMRNVTKALKAIGDDIELVELNADHAIWGYVYDPNNPHGFWPWFNKIMDSYDVKEPEPVAQPVQLAELNGELFVITPDKTFKVEATLTEVKKK